MARARKGRKLLGLCALLALMLMRASASAQSPTLDLQVAPDPRGCITDAALRARVQHYLSRRARPAQVQIAVSASDVGASFSVRRGGRDVAERRFELLPEACGSRLDAIALAIALAVEQATNPRSGSESESESGSGSESESESGSDASHGAAAVPAGEKGAAGAKPEQPEPAKPAAEPGPARDDSGETRAPSAMGGKESELQVRLFAGGGALFEVAPKPAFTVQAGVDLDLVRSFGLRFAALYGRAQAVEIQGGSVGSQLIGGRALACLQLPTGDFALEGCGGIAGGALLASGNDDFAQAHDVALGWFAGSARAALRYPATSLFSLRLALDGHLSIFRPELEVRDLRGEKVDEAAALVAGGAVSIELLLALR
jgi:hypothetical protein